MARFRIWPDAPNLPAPCPCCRRTRQLYQEGPGRAWECLECTFGTEAYETYRAEFAAAWERINAHRAAVGLPPMDLPAH